MTKEEKLRKYIREMIIEVLKESDPYGRPDEDKYLFKTGQDYLAGIQGDSSMYEVAEQPSAEDLAAKQKAAEEVKKKSAYQRFFSQALAKFGYSSPASIPDEKKKEFWDYIDSHWTSNQEKNTINEESFSFNLPNSTQTSEIDAKNIADARRKIKQKYGVNVKEIWKTIIGNDNKYLIKNKKINNKLQENNFYKNLKEINQTIAKKLFDKGYAIYIQDGPGKPETNKNLYCISKKLWDASMNIYTGGISPEKYGFDNIIKWLNEKGAENLKFYTLYKKEHYIIGEISNKKNINENIPMGTYVTVEPTAVGLKDSYPAANWLKTKMKVKLLDEAPNAGTFDVLDVELPNGEIESIYDFNIVDEINETSATGGVAGYETPAAFTGQKGISKKQKRIANQLGYELVDKSYALKDKGDTQNLKEGIDTFYLKDENLTPEQKLGKAMRQVRNNLLEIENVVKKSIALKNENNIGTEDLGKRTYSSLKKIHETVTRLMVALNDMR